MQNRNIPIANCIFTPTLTTALFFIGFLAFRPASLQGGTIYLWAAGGSLLAALIGFIIGWNFRRSDVLNVLLRWLIAALMGLLILLAVYMTIRDIRLMFS